MAARGYIVTKESAHMAQKAQLAMARINRELMEISDIAKAVFQPDPYIIYDHINGRQAIAKDGTFIKMFFNLGATQETLPDLSEGDILIDDIQQLTLSYFKGDQTAWDDTDNVRDLSFIDVEIIVSRADSDIGDKTFSTTVRPRNTRN